jgi:hypothetical protein
MVSKRTGRPRTGRPKKDEDVPFLQNPKRFYVMGLRATMKVIPPPPSIRRAAKIIAQILVGNRVEPESLPPEGREIVAKNPLEITLVSGPDGPVVHKANGSISYKNTKRGANAATIEGAAEYIRKLDRQAMEEAKTDPDDARWLRCAVTGLVLGKLRKDEAQFGEETERFPLRARRPRSSRRFFATPAIRGLRPACRV